MTEGTWDHDVRRPGNITVFVVGVRVAQIERELLPGESKSHIPVCVARIWGSFAEPVTDIAGYEPADVGRTERGQDVFRRTNHIGRRVARIENRGRPICATAV